MERRRSDDGDTALPEPKPKPGLRLLGITLVALAALFALPPTRWIATTHLTMLFSHADAINAMLYEGGMKDLVVPRARLWRPARLQQVADRHPDSFSNQFAAITLVYSEPATEQPNGVPQLLALASRFPGRPALYAAALRFETERWLSMHRDEEDVFESPGYYSSRGNHAPQAADLALFDSAAATGEQIDPGNAYFPLMRAAGQFAGRHDEAALASLHRAAQKTRYDRYLLEDEAARQSLVREAYGERGAFSRIAVMCSLYTPDSVFLPLITRVAIAKAMFAEKRGDRWAGLAIRRDVMRVGSLMRWKSRDLSNVYTGVRFVGMAMFSPGGPPILPKESDVIPSGMSGMPPGMSGSPPGMPPGTAVPTPGKTGSAPGTKAKASGTKTGGWQSGRRRLTESGDYRKRPAKSVDAFYAYLRTVIPPAPAGTELFVTQKAELKALPAWIENECEAGWQVKQAQTKGHDFSLFDGEESYRLTIWWAVGLFAAANAFWMAALTLVANGVLRTRLIKGFVPSMAIVGTFVAAGAFLCHGRAFESMSAVQLVMQCLCTRPNDSDFLRSLAYPGVTVAVSLAVPILFVFLFALVSVLHRVPMSTGILRGLKGAGIPVACLLFLTYAGLALYTARLEAHANRSLDKLMQHEGRYFAELAGMKWPGETALPRHRAGLGSFRDPKPADSNE